MSKKQPIEIQYLKPGMISEELIINNGVPLITPGTVLTDSIIEKLNKLYYKKIIYIKDDEDSNSTVDSSFEEEKTLIELSKNFKEIATNIETMFSKINYTGKANLEDVKKFSQKIIENLNTPYYVIKNIILHGSEDDPIYKHTVNVAALSALIGQWLNFDSNKVNLLTYSAILHDFGKTKIDENIVYKKTELTSSEFDKIKKHPIIGYEIVKELPFINNLVSCGVLFHHERLDGSGYPLNLKGNKIDIFSRIIAIADTFDAVNSDRIYKKSTDPFSALQIIQDESLGKLDFEISYTFIKHMLNYYTGEKALLNDNTIAKIIKIDLNDISRPLLLSDSKFIDLKEHPDLCVMKLLI